MKYLAYGSNLSVEQMVRRCPDAQVVGTTVLRDWRLVFKHFADIVPCKGSEVPMLVWEISEEDEKRLDFYEGFPNHYVKKYFPDGMAYVMTEGRKIAPPSEEYLKVIMTAYFDLGFDATALITEAKASFTNGEQ